MPGPKYGAFADVDGGQLLNELRFLAVAVSDDGTRPVLHGINIEVVSEATEKVPYQILRGVATDGRRLHLVNPLNQSAAPLFGLSPGRWEVISNKPKRVQLARMNNPEGTFPNWEKVFPSEPVKFTTQFRGFALSGRRLSDSSGNLFKLARALPHNDPINLAYLADLGYGDEWTVEWRRERGAILFKNKNVKTALIMPMQGDDE